MSQGGPINASSRVICTFIRNCYNVVRNCYNVVNFNAIELIILVFGIASIVLLVPVEIV